MDEKFSTVGYEAASENIVFSGKREESDTYHETVLYHSTGPSISQALLMGVSEAGANIYDSASVHLLPGATLADPVYEDPTLSQVLLAMS